MRPEVCVGAVVVDAGDLLVVRRGRGPAAGEWSIPGGRVEAGETLAEAALRELREEGGVEAEMIGFLDHAEVIQRDEDSRVKHHFVICAHAARWLAGEPQVGNEALDVRWVTEDELASLPTTPGLAGVLQKAFAVTRILAE